MRCFKVEMKVFSEDATVDDIRMGEMLDDIMNKNQHVRTDYVEVEEIVDYKELKEASITLRRQSIQTENSHDRQILELASGILDDLANKS